MGDKRIILGNKFSDFVEKKPCHYVFESLCILADGTLANEIFLKLTTVCPKCVLAFANGIRGFECTAGWVGASRSSQQRCFMHINAVLCTAMLL